MWDNNSLSLSGKGIEGVERTDIEIVIEVARKAASIIMNYYWQENKIIDGDNFSPVTIADKEASNFIISELKKCFPNDLFLSQDWDEKPTNFNWRVWMINPIDWTKEFLKWSEEVVIQWRGEGFSVMIGLCENGIPKLWVVYAPKTKDLYYAEEWKWAYLRADEGIDTKISVNNIPTLNKTTIFTRFPWGEERVSDIMINWLNTSEQISSSGVWFITWLIARGLWNLHLFTNTRGAKWATCAPQVIIEEAWWRITDYDWKALNYKQENLIWERLFVISNWKVHKETLDEIKNFESIV